MTDLVPANDGRCGSPLDDVLLKLADDVLLKLADDAIEILGELTSRDCFCDDAPGGKCETCIAREAAAKIERLAYPAVRSVASESRLNGPERVFYERWIHENRRVIGVNGGCGALELIMSEDPNNHRAQISQRDMDVATAVVQWLGTKCGMSFIWECEAEIKRRREGDYQDWHNYRLHNTPWKELSEQPKVYQAAKTIADDYGRTESGRRQLEHEILALMQFVAASEEIDRLTKVIQTRSCR